MLYMIGLGLGDEKDISVKGLEAVKKCNKVYLETYTSKLRCSIEDLEKYHGKKIIAATRKLVEEGSEILEDAKKENTAFLVMGDVFSATTHTEIFLEAKKQDIEVLVINNASVLNAVSITGLQLYKFGKIASIPFHHQKVEAPHKVLEVNEKAGLHTLFLLDLSPKDDKYMTINEAIEYLLNVSKARQGVFNENTLCVGCARLGSDYKIKSGTAKDLLKEDFGEPPFCLIVPGNLHFLEEEALESWK